MSKIQLNEFINGNDSICREERQYALYLYNILDKQGSIVIKNNEKKQDYKIEKVFFEVSFLRDYFERCNDDDKKEFNTSLIHFSRNHVKVSPNNKIWDKFEGSDFLQGHVNGWHNKSDVWKTVGTKLPQYLMNAQPDIGMLLSDNNGYHICFIECKYCSGFGKYPSKSSKGDSLSTDEGGYHQLDVQNYIAEFLCSSEYGLNAYYNNEKLKPLSPKCTMVAWFTNNDKMQKKQEYKYPGNEGPVTFEPKLLLNDLINNPIKNPEKKTIEINDGQLEFEKK